ncbi:hypothetical protein BDM02DRAFT_3133008 [Thelephora ganbajun]|uniref:Uncharacterized protein n=1 Tax=Thelephora ganbajun TaxID=370292 RepID=A0ACB6YZ46_THEGA|nr:hypothetical protein BDM02DRAFT_3133008 [Thelephora ganbajun]
MNRLFGKRSKKSPKPSPKHNFPGIPTNAAAELLRPREDLDIGPDGNQIHSCHDLENTKGATAVKTKGFPHRRFRHLALRLMVLKIEEILQERTQLTPERENAEADQPRRRRREYENTALTTTAILSVPKEPAGESSPLGPLKAVLRTIAAVHANHQETVAIGNKIEVLLSCIVALEERFDSRPGDVEEQRRRRELIGCGAEFLLASSGTLKDNCGLCLRSLSRGNLLNVFKTTKRFTGSWKIYGRLCLITRTTGGATKGNIRSTAQANTEAAVLNGFPCAKGAEYRHGDRRGCMKGTRGTVLDEIGLWARDFDRPPVYWLNGLAGTGKSTIAQTIAERTFADGQLGASFFCSRDFEDRRNLKFIFPTIAVQLARNYADFRSIFVPLIQSTHKRASRNGLHLSPDFGLLLAVSFGELRKSSDRREGDQDMLKVGDEYSIGYIRPLTPFKVSPALIPSQCGWG